MSDKEKLCDQFHQNEGFYDYLDAVVVAKVEIEIDGQLFQVGFNDKSHTLIFFNPRTKRMFIAALEDMLRVAIENGLDDGDSPAPAGHSITERRFQPPPIVEEGEEKHRFQP